MRSIQTTSAVSTSWCPGCHRGNPSNWLVYGHRERRQVRSEKDSLSQGPRGERLGWTWLTHVGGRRVVCARVGRRRLEEGVERYEEGRMSGSKTELRLQKIFCVEKSGTWRQWMWNVDDRCVWSRRGHETVY